MLNNDSNAGTAQKKRRVLYDSYNIALPKGTGVATYARALIKIAPSLGIEPELFYDFKGVIPKDLDLAKAILFEERSRKLTTLDHARNLIESYVSFSRTTKAQALPDKGFVYEDPIRHRLTQAKKRYVARHLFSRAGRYFSTRGEFLELAFDVPPDLAHFTFQMPVSVKNAPNIYTIHDLVPLVMPYATLDNRKNTYKLMNKLAASADHIVTVSEHSRQDIIKVLKIDPARVTNTYQSIALPEEAINKSDEAVADEVSGIFGLEPGGYFLFFGAVEPKKNVKRLIEAYLSSRVKKPLVIVSSGGWQNEDELQMIKENPLRPDGSGIISLGYLPYDFLISLIKGARAVTFPSIYEGFGLPALEAMALGTPVLTSNTSSLVEVAGDAALMVNPIETGNIRDGIRKLDADDDLCAELRRRGVQQAQKFSIAAYTEKLRDLYAKVM